jgi:hypothetical protein
MPITTVITPELIKNSFTYSSYRSHIDELLKEDKTTGDNHSPDMINYTRMNVQRMNRWDKAVVINAELQEKVGHITTPQIWLVLTEAWCGDAAQNIPFFVKLASQNPLIELRFILRDENPEIMDAYLTNGGRSIPKLVALNKDDFEELFTWGPRPQVLQQKYFAYREDSKGVSQEDFIESIHLWYARDKNSNINAEFMTLIN